MLEDLRFGSSSVRTLHVVLLDAVDNELALNIPTAAFTRIAKSLSHCRHYPLSHYRRVPPNGAILPCPTNISNCSPVGISKDETGEQQQGMASGS